MVISRREVLRAGLMGGLVVATGGAFERAAAAARRGRTAAAGDETVVVVVTLVGGNDGLNTVVPLRQYDLYRAMRPAVRVARQRLLPLAGLEQDFAFNPGLEAFARLFAAGRLAVIPGAASPRDAQGLFDHFASRQNLHTATTYGSAPPAAPTGWLGRFLDGLDPVSLPRGISLGVSKLLLTGARTTPLVISSLDGLGINPTDDAVARSNAYRRLQQGHAAAGPAEYNRQLREQLMSLGGDLEAVGASYVVPPGVTYPNTPLGGALRDCAALIAARRGVRALEVDQAGFDTHVAQQIGPPSAAPYHELLCSFVGDAVAAFQADIDAHGLGDKVLTLVCSEFGRRPAGNSAYGTDHGFAGLMFALGGPVRGGVWSDYPDLRDEYLVLDGNLDRTVDFRSVYATILARHLGADPGPILGGDFELLGFL